MKITQVNISLSNRSDRLLATANIILEDAYAVNGIRIFRRVDGGLQVQYPVLPSYNPKNEAFSFKPILAESHKYIERIILEEYQKCVDSTICEPSSKL